jgi:hypothetical protein
MTPGWVILHGGALGDLVLTLQLALRLARGRADGRLHVISRTDPGELSACRPSITRQSADGMGLHWLYSENDAPAPAKLEELLRGARVLSALGDARSRPHERLLALRPACGYSFDPRPRPGLSRHITQQWLTDLESQGLLIPKCIHQRPTQHGLGVPDELRARGRAVLEIALADGSQRTAVWASEAAGNAAHEAAGSGSPVGGCVLIHPGSGGRDKCWPLPNFLAVGRGLQQSGSPVCFLVGPVELERREPAELRSISDSFPVLRNPPPADLVAALSAARVLVANDSGPAHLAALVGTATVTIFGPSEPAIWRPLGPNALTVSGDPQHHATDWNLDPLRIANLVSEAYLA